MTVSAIPPVAYCEDCP